MGSPEATSVESAGTTAKARKARGVVYFNLSRCKGCGFCIAFCPPKVLAFSTEFNAQGYHFPQLLNAEECAGCDLCGLFCPDFAIYGIMLKNVPRRAAGSAEEKPGERP